MEGVVRMEQERDGLTILDSTYKTESSRKVKLKSCLTIDSEALFGDYEDKPNLAGNKAS